MNSYTINQISQLPELAKKLLEFAQNSKIFILKGNLGAGKTTFVKTIAQELGCNETVSSPTYAIVNHYKTLQNTSIFHFDLYRLNSVEEIENIGFWDYLDHNNYLFIEWADLILPYLENPICIDIATLPDNQTREFTFSILPS